MESTYSAIKKEIADSIEGALEALNYKADSIENTIDFSKSFGDISCSVSFRLAKEHKKNADLIAKEIMSKAKKPDNVEKITVENGFINFHLDREKFSKSVLEEKEPAPKQSGKKAIIEYPSVNPNKPWHVGHLRNALLGDSISNMYTALGFDVEREDYIDDLGLQMAETAWWHMNHQERPEKKFDHWLGEVYVKVNEHLGDPSAKEDVAKVMSLMSQDGTYESKILRELATECVKAQYQTAFDYSVFHDLLVWESDIVRENILEKGLDMLKKCSFVETPNSGDYANCLVINLRKIESLPDEFKGLKEDMKVLVRSDGTSTYIAKDLAFHMWKLGIIENTFKYSVFMVSQPNGKALYTTSQDGKKMDFAGANAVINIIDTRQSYPQSILRLALRAMGKAQQADSIMHLAYGEVELESGALSGRKGTWIGYSADDLLRETETKARTLAGSKFKFGKSEADEVIKGVALAAIKFEFLKFGPEKKIVFSWDKALNFEGNSGPYAQYMHARATRILEEAPRELLTRKQSELPAMSEDEFLLIKTVSKEHHILEKAANELRPNVITEYINELAYSFATFYEKSPILKAESEAEKVFRLKLTASFKGAMKRMLEILGIDALERM
jgi:arginyl-tRNA synthetase